jgi:GT2 family glycosyltransferase
MRSTSPLISIIIVNYNGIKWLKNCLDSLLKQSYTNHEIILVDNCSNDGSYEFVKSNYPNVKLLRLDKNYGFAKANNIALRYAKGEYLLLLNNDTIVQDGWLENLVKAALENPEYKLLASVQLPDQKGGKTRDLMVYFDASIYSTKCNIKRNIVDSAFASGACFLIHKDWIKEVKYLFDEFYFMTAEDLDLSLRTLFAGGKIGYVMNSKLIHFVGGSSGRYRSKISRLAVRNQVLTAYKLFQNKYFMKILIVKLMHIIVRMIVKAYDFKNNISMLLGYLESFGIIMKYKEYKSYITKIKKISDIDVIKNFKYKSNIQRLLYKFLVG